MIYGFAFHPCTKLHSIVLNEYWINILVSWLYHLSIPKERKVIVYGYAFHHCTKLYLRVLGESWLTMFFFLD